MNAVVGDYTIAGGSEGHTSNVYKHLHSVRGGREDERESERERGVRGE
jgi:hypothetical protein